MNEIIRILEEEIKEYDLMISDINKKLSELRPIYNILKPHGKKYDDNDIARIEKDDDLINRIIEICKKINFVRLYYMIAEKQRYDDERKKLIKKLLDSGANEKVIFDNEKTHFSQIVVDNDISRNYADEVRKLEELIKEQDKKIV